MDEIPNFSVDLIEELDKHFRPPSAEDMARLEVRELAYRAGQRAVVDFLKMAHARQKEEALDV